MFLLWDKRWDKSCTMGRPSSLNSPHLQRRGASYYFRLTVPPRLVALAGRQVIKVSLRTSYLRTAQLRAASLLNDLQAIMPASATHPNAPPMDNLRDKLEALLGEMNERWTGHHTGRLRPLEEDQLEAETDTLSLVRSDCMQALQTGDVLRWKDSARYFIAEHGLAIAEGSSEFRELCYELGKLEARTLSFSLAALRGEAPPPDAAPRTTSAPAPQIPHTAPALTGNMALLLSDVYEKFCQHKTAQGVWKNPKESRSHDYDPIIPPFIAFVKDKPLGLLTLDDVEGWATHIMAGEGRKLGTKKRDLDRVKAVLNYARQRLGAADFTGVLKLEKGYSDIHASYEPFTPPELVKLFCSDAYKSNSFKKASQFWLPLLGLYTGARIDEPASMALSDITEHAGIPAFFMSGEGNAGGKNEYAPRWIPIHPKLLEAGFLAYVETLRSEGHERLFPDIGAAARDGYAKRATTDFTDYRRSVGVGTGEGSRSTKTYHSFRSTVSTRLTGAGVDGDTARRLVGHAGKDVHERVYLKHLGEQWVKPAAEALAKLDYGLTHPKWADTEQYRKARTRKLRSR